MKFFLLLIIFLFIVNLFGQIEFELDYNIPIDSSLGQITNVQIMDIDNDNVDEILVDQILPLSGQTSIFSQSGLVLYEFEQIVNIYERFQKSLLYSEDNNTYLMFASSLKMVNSDDIYIKMKTYDLTANTIIDSLTTFLFSEGNISVFNMNILNCSDDSIVYIGLSHSTMDYGPWLSTHRSYLTRFYFNNGYCTFIDYIQDCGYNFEYFNWSNSILSAGYYTVRIGEFAWNVTKTAFLKKLSNDINHEIDEIISLEGSGGGDDFSTHYNDYPMNFQILTKNDRHQQEFGSILYNHICDTYTGDYSNYTCYSPDFSDILWSDIEISNTSYTVLYSCLNPSDELPENCYLIIFPDLNYDSFRVMNRVDGQIELTQDLTFIPDHIIRNNSQHIDFIDYLDGYSGINIYSINSEYVTAKDELIENNSLMKRLDNFPNPFNPSTTIEFSIQNDSKVELSIYNIKGQKIKTLANSEFNKGSHSIIWDGRDESRKSASSGVYYYQLIVNGRTEAVKKCLLLK